MFTRRLATGKAQTQCHADEQMTSNGCTTVVLPGHVPSIFLHPQKKLGQVQRVLGKASESTRVPRDAWLLSCYCPQAASSLSYANHRASPAPASMQGQLRERVCPVHNHRLARLSSGLSPSAGRADHSIGIGGGGWSSRGAVTAVILSTRHRLHNSP